MRKWLFGGCLLLATGLLALLSGCGRSGWTMHVTDRQGLPISGAQACVWLYPLDPHHPRKDAEALGQAWEQGTMSIHGYFFTTDSNGWVRCAGFPTGGEVVDGYSPGYYRMGHGGFIIRDDYRYRDDRVIFTTPRSEYIPPRYHLRWQKGDWLAMTVSAKGYRSTTFAFRPDAPSGDLGSIQLLPAD